jgi:hypothetical protein
MTRQINDRDPHYMVARVEREDTVFELRTTCRSVLPWTFIMRSTLTERDNWMEDKETPTTLLWDSRFVTTDGVWRATIQFPNGTLD